MISVKTTVVLFLTHDVDRLLKNFINIIKRLSDILRGILIAETKVVLKAGYDLRQRRGTLREDSR